MKKSFLLLPALVLFLSACNNGNAVNENPNGTGNESPASATPDSGSQITSGGSDTAMSSANPPAANVALNPPHGQPGHRCEIPVGAPLDGSAPANNTQGQTPISNNPATQSGSAAPANAKINPPHGQPGHDCAVPVGAPLPG